ncbi:transposase [Streptomyces sp. NPDC059352]|uniref:IS110 family transposase n=1 Tax=Streptomyces sp. NPDC059352 TaxID=3346810 RepID=UPI0036C3199B
MTSVSMTQPARLHHDRRREVVLGVDTRKDAHGAAVVSTTGRLIGSRSFPTTADGYRQLLDWTRSDGTVDRAGVECTGSCESALSRFLRGNDLAVIE